MEAKREWLLRRKGEDTWTKAEVLAIMADVTRVQQCVQEAVSLLGQTHLQSREKEPLSLMEAHELVRTQGLPKDPLKDYGLSTETFHELLGTYQDEPEVILRAQQMMHPPGRGDRQRARQMTIEQIVQTHEAMGAVLRRMLEELRALDPAQLMRLELQLLEATAELLSYLEVSALQIHPEDVEEAISMNEYQLQNNPDFMKSSEDLANLMQELLEVTEQLRAA
ncbi:unnamed protein product [Durusdinium trenchii]